MQKRSYGDTVTGTLGADLDDRGLAGEVKHEREEWLRKRGQL